MKAREYRHQLSKKAMSGVWIYILLLLISVFSGMIVRFMAAQLINDFILRTLSLRLLLHGISLSYSSMYSLPVGTTQFYSTFPLACVWECADCNATVLPFIGRVIDCDCEDGIQAKNNLLKNFGTDELAIVCDDNYIIQNVKPVILYDGTTPLSMAVKLNLQLYPKADIFWSFKDLISNFISSSEFFDREITVFTEMPLNLNDYASTRKLLSESFDYSTLLRVTDDNFRLNRQGYDNYDSVLFDISRNEGLMSIVSKVYELTNNASGKGPLITEDGNDFLFYLKPGLKINMSDDKTLCEYECPSQNTLESECPDNYWYKVSCFNFSEFESLNCPECTVGDFNYEIDISGCLNNECVGNTTINYDEFNFVNTVTGSKETIQGKDYVKSIILYPGEDDYRVNWHLANDCNLSLSLDCSKDPNKFFINVFKGTADEGELSCTNLDNALRGFCEDMDDTFVINRFTDCDSKGIYEFDFVDDFQVLNLKDTPSKLYFETILSSFMGQTISVISEDYEINIFGSCDEPNNFRVELDPISTRTVYSKIGIASENGLNDQLFRLNVSNPSGNNVLIKLEGSRI